MGVVHLISEAAMKDLLLRAAEIIYDYADSFFYANAIKGKLTKPGDERKYNGMMDTARELRKRHEKDAREKRS